MSTRLEPSLSSHAAGERARLAAGGSNPCVIASEVITTPIGDLKLGASPTGLCSCTFEDATGDRLGGRAFEGEASEVARLGATDDVAREHLAAAVVQLREYFAGLRREFTVPLDPDFSVPSPFTRACWAHLCTIPFGATRSYGEVARALGDAKASRAVGNANSRNPICIIQPCHRVIGADGSLTGFAGGVERKRWLLRHERAHPPSATPTLFATNAPETP